MLSFWEKQSLLHTDIAIVGGGITGLSVAASLVERLPEASITVFERSSWPYGASTRNAGFACFGSLTEILADVQVMGENRAMELVYKRWKGLGVTRKRLGDRAIGFRASGGYELLEEKHEHAFERIEAINALVHDFLPGYLYPDPGFAGRSGLKAAGACVGMKGEGQVDTGRLVQALEAYVTARGVRIRTGAQVEGWTRTGTWHLDIRDAIRGSVPFEAAKLIVCTNAFAPALLPGIALKPGRGQVLVTEPIPGLHFQGNLHIDEGFYYLRNVGERLLFGGARNLDPKGEESTEFKLHERIQHHLETRLHELIDLPVSAGVEMRWAGIMAFGDDKFPLVQRLDDGLYCALKMGGMGVALAGAIGEEVAGMVEEAC